MSRVCAEDMEIEAQNQSSSLCGECAGKAERQNRRKRASCSLLPYTSVEAFIMFLHRYPIIKHTSNLVIYLFNKYLVRAYFVPSFMLQTLLTLSLTQEVEFFVQVKATS